MMNGKYYQHACHSIGIQVILFTLLRLLQSDKLSVYFYLPISS